MNNIKKVIKQAKKAMDGIGIPSIERYLKSMGYTVLYIGTPEADEEILRYNLQKYARDKQAFAFCGAAKFIFVKGKLHPSTKQLLLLHELGHILLGHIGKGQSMYIETNEIEAEADAFAYTMLTQFRRAEVREKVFSRCALGLACVLLLLSLVNCSRNALSNMQASTVTTKNEVPLKHKQQSMQSTEPTPSRTPSATATETPATTIEDTVYITPTGECYHLATCSYKGNNAAPVSRDEAITMYRPCKKCNP